MQLPSFESLSNECHTVPKFVLDLPPTWLPVAVPDHEAVDYQQCCPRSPAGKRAADDGMQHADGAGDDADGGDQTGQQQLLRQRQLRPNCEATHENVADLRVLGDLIASDERDGDAATLWMYRTRTGHC